MLLAFPLVHTAMASILIHLPLGQWEKAPPQALGVQASRQLARLEVLSTLVNRCYMPPKVLRFLLSILQVPPQPNLIKGCSRQFPIFWVLKLPSVVTKSPVQRRSVPHSVTPWLGPAVL